MSNGEMDLWTALEYDRMASATYDPLGGMTASQVMSPTVRAFPPSAFTSPTVVSPAQPWLIEMADPVPSWYDPISGFFEKSYEKLPELLWGYGLEKAGVIDRPKPQVVDEGAGVVVTHTQPPQAGGAPAQPITTTIPSTLSPVFGPLVSAVKETDKMIWIGAGLFVLYLLIGRK